MGIHSYRPTSAGRRWATVLDFSALTKKAPEKALTKRGKNTAGRNHHGHTTSWHLGGGHKKVLREVDFRRDKDGIVARVIALEYDPNRSAFLALLAYADGEKRYILAPEGLKVGDTVESGVKVEPKAGNAMPLAGIPLGLSVHCVELVPGRGGQLARAAGTVVQLMAREGEYAHLLLPSGEIRRVRVRCRATIGQVGNLDHQNVVIGKAGRHRHMGRRPINRGTSMNPVAHPMGGGEGRSHGGRHPCSPWGKLSKGGKTRERRKTSSRFIVRRRRAGARGNL